MAWPLDIDIDTETADLFFDLGSKKSLSHSQHAWTRASDKSSCKPLGAVTLNEYFDAELTLRFLSSFNKYGSSGSLIPPSPS